MDTEGKFAVLDNVIDNINRRVTAIEFVCPKKSDKISNCEGRIMKMEGEVKTLMYDVNKIFSKIDELVWTVGKIVGIGIALNVIVVILLAMFIK